MPHVLKPHEVEKMLKAAATDRDRLMLQAAIHMGLRVSEIHRLRIEHFDFNNRRAFVVQSKFGRERYVPVHPKLCIELLHFFGVRRNGPVFVSRQGNPICSRMIQKIVEKARDGFHATPHTLRHTSATNLMRACGDLRVVQDFLGHSSPSTTAIYTHVSINDIIEAANKVEWLDVLPESQMKLI